MDPFLARTQRLDLSMFKLNYLKKPACVDVSEREHREAHIALECNLP